MDVEDRGDLPAAPFRPGAPVDGLRDVERVVTVAQQVAGEVAAIRADGRLPRLAGLGSRCPLLRPEQVGPAACSARPCSAPPPGATSSSCPAANAPAGPGESPGTRRAEPGSPGPRRADGTARGTPTGARDPWPGRGVRGLQAGGGGSSGRVLRRAPDRDPRPASRPATPPTRPRSASPSSKAEAPASPRQGTHLGRAANPRRGLRTGTRRARQRSGRDRPARGLGKPVLRSCTTARFGRRD